MDSQETAEAKPAAAVFECANCEDTHKVRVAFTGANGTFLREVACPVCGPDVTMTTPGSREMAQYDKRLSLIAALAIIAAILAAMAYLATRDDNPFAQAVKEVTE